MIQRLATGLVVLAALLALPAGCTVYWGEDDDDDDCAEIARLGLRDPQSGVCEGFGSSCDDPRVGAPEPAEARDWATCPGPCEGLDEASCLADVACRAAYTECPPNARCEAPWNFHECWGLAPSGPDDSRVACSALDAHACSRRNDCEAHYRPLAYFTPPALALRFFECASETPVPGCYGDSECPSGWDCTSETECLPPPGCEPGEACPPVCYGRCVPPGDVCAGIDCGPEAHCEPRCYPCDSAPGFECPPTPICEGTCVPGDEPGDCYGDAACAMPPPVCPDGTVAGVQGGCWTGSCVPLTACTPV